MSLGSGDPSAPEGWSQISVSGPYTWEQQTLLVLMLVLVVHMVGGQAQEERCSH